MRKAIVLAAIMLFTIVIPSMAWETVISRTRIWDDVAQAWLVRVVFDDDGRTCTYDVEDTDEIWLGWGDARWRGKYCHHWGYRRGGYPTGSGRRFVREFNHHEHHENFGNHGSHEHHENHGGQHSGGHRR